MLIRKGALIGRKALNRIITVMMTLFLRGQVWKRVWKTTFFGLKWVRIWRSGRHTATKNSLEYPRGLFLHKNLRMHDIRWLRNLRAVCWCRGKPLRFRKLPLRLSAGVVCCPLQIFKPSSARREKLPQKVGRKEKLAQKAGRREFYPPVPPPSFILLDCSLAPLQQHDTCHFGDRCIQSLANWPD